VRIEALQLTSEDVGGLSRTANRIHKDQELRSLLFGSACDYVRDMELLAASKALGPVIETVHVLHDQFQPFSDRAEKIIISKLREIPDCPRLHEVNLAPNRSTLAGSA
jgi:hypothetical protein